jgi:hypothetical protein
VASRLDGQLEDVAAEVVTRPVLFRIDQVAKQVTVSPIFCTSVGSRFGSAKATIAPLAKQTSLLRAGRAPTRGSPTAARFVNQNDFQVSYGTFDWRLNDLAARR